MTVLQIRNTHLGKAGEHPVEALRQGNRRRLSQFGLPLANPHPPRQLAAPRGGPAEPLDLVQAPADEAAALGVGGADGGGDGLVVEVAVFGPARGAYNELDGGAAGAWEEEELDNGGGVH
jgi:hypothetical protein